MYTYKQQQGKRERKKRPNEMRLFVCSVWREIHVLSIIVIMHVHIQAKFIITITAPFLLFRFTCVFLFSLLLSVFVVVSFLYLCANCVAITVFPTRLFYVFFVYMLHKRMLLQ